MNNILMTIIAVLVVCCGGLLISYAFLLPYVYRRGRNDGWEDGMDMASTKEFLKVLEELEEAIKDE